MKMRYFLFAVFSLLLAGNMRAQTKLTCTFCKVGSGPVFYYTPYTISTTPDIPIADEIQLSYSDLSEFTITGSGKFTISGVISGDRADRVYGIKLIAGSGTLILTGVNSYSGNSTTISGGLLGGSGTIVYSPVTVGPGGGIFGGTGKGDNGVFTTGNLTFTGIAANHSHVAVYANNTNGLFPLSLIQVGGVAGSRTGTGTLTADAGATIDIDFMEPVTVADGVFTVISCRDASALSGTFQVGINNSGCCLGILKNGAGIQVTVKKMTLTPPVLSLCPSVLGIPQTVLNAACGAITAATPGVWSITNNANNADEAPTTGTATLASGTVTTGNNPATVTGGDPGSVKAVFTIPASPDAGCAGTIFSRLDIFSKPVVSGTSCSRQTISLTGTAGQGATLTGADWNIYSTISGSGISKQTATASIANGNPLSTGIVTPLANGTVYVRFFDSNQCPSEPFTFSVNTPPVLELLAGGIPGMPNTTCPAGSTSGNIQPVILARYTDGAPTSTAGITWTFTSAAPLGWQEPATVTTATHPTGITGTYAIQCNTPSLTAYSTAYTVKYTDANACSSTLNLTVTRQSLLTNNSTQTAAPVTLCTGGTAVFTHTNSDSPCTWHSDDPGIAGGDQEGVANASGSETVTAHSAGSTTIYVTDVHGCNSEKVQVTAGAPVITVPSPSLCATTGLSAGSMELKTQSESGTVGNPWSLNPANDAVTLSGMAADKKTIRLEVAKTNLTAPVTVTVQYNTGTAGCTGSKDITINPSPVIDIGEPFSVCANVNGSAGTLSLGSSSAPGTEANPWSFNPAGTDADLSHLSDDKKTITFTVHDKDQLTRRSPVVQYIGANGCAAGKLITIYPNPKLKVAAGIDLSNLCSNGIYFNFSTISSVDGVNDNWRITNNGINTHISISAHTSVILSTGITTQAAVAQTITYTSDYGCLSNAITYTVIPGRTITLSAKSSTKLCHAGTLVELRTPEFANYTWFSGNEAVATVDYQGLVTAVAAGTAIITARLYGNHLCTGSQEVVVEDPQVRGIDTGLNTILLCPNKEYTDVLTLTNGDERGAWRVYDSFHATAVTTTATSAFWGTDRASAVKKGSIHTGNTNVTVDHYVAFTQNDCESNRLSIHVFGPPVMEMVSNQTFCAGVATERIIMFYDGIFNGAGGRYADIFKWSGGADIGLADKTDWTASLIPSFIPVNTTTSTVNRTITVLSSNSYSKCVSTGSTFSVSVDPVPVVTVTPATPLCSGSKTDFGLQPNVFGMLYTWTVTLYNGVGATDEATKKNAINQTLTNRGASDVTVAYTITPQTAGGCKGRPVSAAIVVKNTPSVSTAGATGGGSFCLTPVANGTNGNPRSKPGGTYTTHITPKISPDNPHVKWFYKSTHSANVSGTSTSGTTPQTLTTIQDNLVSTGSESETVTYSFTPQSDGCFATATEVKIVLNPTPEFTGDVNSVPDITFCGGKEVQADIDIKQVASTGPAKPTGFTWVAAATGDDTGLADYTDATHPRKNIGPFSLVNTTTDKHRSITLTPRNADTGCTGLEQVVEILLKAGPEILPVNPAICSTDPNPLLLTTVNPGGAANDPANPWTVLSGAEYGSVAYHSMDGTKGDFTPVKNAPGGQAATGIKTVKVQYTDSRGCTAVAKVSVDDPVEIVSFTPATHPDLCAGETDDKAATTSIGISATRPGTQYIWSAAKGTERRAGNVTVNGTALPTVLSTVPKEAPLLEKIKAPTGSDADIIFSVTPVSGSCAGAVKTITVRVLGNSLATNVTPVTNTICSGLAPNITVGSANDGNTYTWTTDDHGGSVTGAAAQTTGVSGGTLINSVLSIPSDQKVKKAGLAKYFITVANGTCQGSAAEVTVEVNPNPVITGATSGSICNNSPTGIVLAADIDAAEANKVKYSWTVNENHIGATAGPAPQSAFTEQTLKAVAPPGSSTNQPITGGTEAADVSVTYTFTAAYGSCEGTAVDIVRTLAFPITMNTISGGGKACLGDEVTLTSNAKGGDITYKWWKNSDTSPIDGAVEQSYTAPSDAESNNSYHVSVSNPCQSNLSAPLVSVQVTKDGFFEGATAKATYPSGGATLSQDWVKFTYTPAHEEDAAHTVYAWDFGDNTFLASSQNPSHLYTAGSGSVTPTLTVKKAGLDACSKTWSLPPIVLPGTKFDPTTGDPNSAGLQVSPVPARDQITITNESEINRITVSDLNGKQVLSTRVAGNRVVVPVSGLSSGLYILTIETGQGVKYVKIVKE